MTRTIRLAGHDGFALAASTTGPEDGFPVLLAHGGGQTRRAWRKTADMLAAQGFRVVAVDLRGHGESAWAARAEDYGVDWFARDMVAVAQGFATPPAYVGASLGGTSGMLAAGEFAPGCIASLTLVDIAAAVSDAGVERIMAFMGKHVADGFASPDEAADAIAGYTPERPKRGPSDSLRHYLRKGADGRFRWHWDPKFMAGVNGRDMAREGRMDAAAANLNLPVHLVRGNNSDLLTPEGVAHFIELCPHAEFTDIAGAGHMVVGDKNDAFSEAIAGFLARTHLAR
jgi:pimeloyl-ACP methyl ester carboxylesterase